MAEPWSKFFWSDYEADEGLRVCSLAAQGLWMRMLCVMARATPKGELRIATEPCSVRDLARIASESEETVGALLDELRRRGVCSITRAGVIFSRRMRKDAEISRKRAESGAKGGNASLGYKKENRGLLKQNSSKGVSKNQAPEARSQKPDNTPLPPKADPPPKAESGKEYVFEGRTIRVDRKQFELWREAYHCIPDVRAELQGLDDWLQGPNVPDAKRQNWFHLVSNNLRRKHEERAAALRDQQAADAAFLRRHPPQKFTEAEARALMNDADFERWRARQVESHRP